MLTRRSPAVRPAGLIVPPGQIRQGLRYVRGTSELLIPLVMIGVIGALAWEFPVSLPLMASRYSVVAPPPTA